MSNLYNDLFGLSSPQDGTVIELAEHGRVGGVSTGQSFKFVRNTNESLVIDEADASTTYIGKTSVGSATDTSSAIWQIVKISISGTVTTMSHADGNDNFDNIWDNRASLSYS